jgi:hypothetical protein
MSPPPAPVHGSTAARLRTTSRLGASIVLGIGCAAMGLVAGPAAGASAAGSGGVVVDRVVRDGRIGESSGLVTARRSAGVVWTHNDSGNPPLLYALAADGTTTATLRLSGVANVDWEAIAPATGRDGTPLLAVGDIGDNGADRGGIEVDLVAEPRVTPGAVLTAVPQRVIRLRYPDGAHDAEALLSDPRSGRLYVVTKGLLSSTVYAVPEQAWPGGSGRSVAATLLPLGQVALTLVTDGAVLPDGRVLLRTYGSLAVLAPLPAPVPAGTSPPRLDPLATVPLPGQRQGEGLAVADSRAGVVLLSSEGVGQGLLRFTVPADAWRAGAVAASARSASPQPSPSSKPAASTTPGTAATRGTDGTGGTAGTPGTAGSPDRPGGVSAWVITLAGAAAFGLMVALGGLAARLRRR